MCVAPGALMLQLSTVAVLPVSLCLTPGFLPEPLSPCSPPASLYFSMSCPQESLAALLLWFCGEPSMGAGTRNSHHPPEPWRGIRQAWRLNQTCLREKLAAWWNGDTLQGKCVVPEEVLTPLRDHNPFQGRETHEGPWPTGDLYWNREMKGESIQKTWRCKAWQRKTSKRWKEAEKMRKQRVTEKQSWVWPQALVLLC